MNANKIARMLLTSGVVVRTVTLLPRRRITDLTWQETFFGQLLGYGTFLRRRGHPVRSRPHLAEAMAIAESCGAA